MNLLREIFHVIDQTANKELKQLNLKVRTETY